MLNCKEASRLLSQRLDAPLPPGRRLALFLHLLFCDACRHFERQTMLLREAMRRYRT